MILGIRGIKESVYQDIFAKGEVMGEARGEAKGRVEGRVDEARAAILRLGSKKFGEGDEGIRKKIEAIDDIDQLNFVLDRIFDTSTWDELLSRPAPPA
jgi:predicted transposase YdaD